MLITVKTKNTLDVRCNNGNCFLYKKRYNHAAVVATVVGVVAVVAVVAAVVVVVVVVVHVVAAADVVEFLL